MNPSSRHLPPATQRLAFQETTIDDLDDMAALLGDPDVMRYYPRPKDRGEALSWINWNRDLYQREGFGLWLVRSRETEIRLRYEREASYQTRAVRIYAASY